MIGRTNRFHGRGSIGRVYAGGKATRSGVLALRFAENPRRSTYRLAVVVSRKVSKSAVVRNRIRRRLYERVRILFNSFTAPYDLVILVYDDKIAGLTSDALDVELAKLIKKAGLTSAVAHGHAIVDDKGTH